MPFTRASRPTIKATSAHGWICDACRRRLGPTRQYTRTVLTIPALRDKRTTPLRLRTAVGEVRQLSTTARRCATSRRNSVLPDTPARTRFAPSPTGHLHIGGLRTALFSYLLAKRTGGQFLLRIEDTDQKRLVSGAEQRLLEDLAWSGLQWDEGPRIGGPHGPYKQSERSAIYQEHARRLLDAEAAYRCFCTPQTAGHDIAAYVTSGCYQNCASIPAAEARARGDSARESFTVRLKQTEDRKKRIYPDLVYGKITPLRRSPTSVASSDDDAVVDAADTILIKSDGTPTYHFANVVDDHLMQITHVIRGTEWMASTPLHYDLYHAFGWEPPFFAHVGLLVDENKAKLSKRSNADVALDVRSMRDELGVMPRTLVNFLALLGWSNPTENDVMDMEALARNFDLKFTKGNTMVRMEKLWYLQKRHVAQLCEHARSTGSLGPLRTVAHQIRDEVCRQYGTELEERFRGDDDKLLQQCLEILLADGKSYQNPSQYAQRIRYFFVFDAKKTTEGQDFYGKGQDVSAEDVHSLAQQILLNLQADTSSETQPSRVNASSERIDAVIHNQIWQRVSMLRMSQKGAQQDETEAQVPQEHSERHTDRPVSALPADHPVSKMKKSWTTALMQYLREKVSYGQPGPSISVVMALLGHEECRKRLNPRP